MISLAHPGIIWTAHISPSVCLGREAPVSLQLPKSFYVCVCVGGEGWFNIIVLGQILCAGSLAAEMKDEPPCTLPAPSPCRTCDSQEDALPRPHGRAQSLVAGTAGFSWPSLGLVTTWAITGPRWWGRGGVAEGTGCRNRSGQVAWAGVELGTSLGLSSPSSSSLALTSFCLP